MGLPTGAPVELSLDTGLPPSAAGAAYVVVFSLASLAPVGATSLLLQPGPTVAETGSAQGQVERRVGRVAVWGGSTQVILESAAMEAATVASPKQEYTIDLPGRALDIVLWFATGAPARGLGLQ